MSTQDWNQVVITKKKPSAGTTVKDVDAVRCRRCSALCSRTPGKEHGQTRVTLTRCVRHDAQARRAGAQVAAVKKCASRAGARRAERLLWVFRGSVAVTRVAAGARTLPPGAAAPAE
jgi:hypothetical protein